MLLVALCLGFIGLPVIIVWIVWSMHLSIVIVGLYAQSMKALQGLERDHEI